MAPGEAEMASRVAAAEARRRAAAKAANEPFAGVALPPARPGGMHDTRRQQEQRRQKHRATAAASGSGGRHLESLLLNGSSRMKPGDISFVVRSHVRSLERSKSMSGNYYVMMMAKKRAELAAAASAAALTGGDGEDDAAPSDEASSAPAGVDDLSKILAPYLVRSGSGNSRRSASKVASATPSQQDANQLAASWAQHHKQLGIMAKSSIRAPRQLLNIRAMYSDSASSAGGGGGGVVWEWEAFEAGSGVWHRYNTDDAVVLEDAHAVFAAPGADKRTTPNSATITNSTGSYRVNFKTMKQHAKLSKFSRKVRRTVQAAKPAPSAADVAAAAAAVAAQVPTMTSPTWGIRDALERVALALLVLTQAELAASVKCSEGAPTGAMWERSLLSAAQTAAGIAQCDEARAVIWKVVSSGFAKAPVAEEAAAAAVAETPLSDDPICVAVRAGTISSDFSSLIIV
tara:strand:- start:941 stop:2317 length:1377 start_codon:yes stop_codon:yes gene_type:complete